MFKSTNEDKKATEIIIWGVFYFNPILPKETEQFRRKILKSVKFLNPIRYEFEELTAFLIVKLQLNCMKSTRNSLGKFENKKQATNELLLQIKKVLEKEYVQYLSSLTNRFLKEVQKNQELKEATSFVIKNLIMIGKEKDCFLTNVYNKIESKTYLYFDVIQKSTIFLGSALKEKYSNIHIKEKELSIVSEKPIIHLLDELILFNFSYEYSKATRDIFEKFLSSLIAVNKQLKTVEVKSKELVKLIELLKGKSFEILDNIYDIRRQIARQDRAEREVSNQSKELTTEVLNEFIQDFSVKEGIQEILILTDKIITEIDYWLKNIREFEAIEENTEENATLVALPTQELCEFFTNMEVLRIWSEFFYDVSYFTAKKGRTSDSIDKGQKNTIDTNNVLVVSDVYKTYKLPKSRVYALRGVSFDVKLGEFIAIMGPSGAGKTTLVNILTGLDSPDKGAIYLNGKNIALLNDAELTRFRRDQVGLVFQFYQLFPELTALENVALPAEMAGTPINEAYNNAKEKLMIVNLGMFVNQYPDKLSGGQQQRVAIARSLVNNPKIIVADQLTGDLDSVTGMQIIGYLKKINKEKGTTILLATHNKAVATQADRILMIEDGEIIEEVDMTKLIDVTDP